MSGIRALDPVVVDQIAAGEVVERPASVVKELVENALDAGATRIEVRLREGGTRRIEVRDDGDGIPAGELELAVTSHATSKLARPEDLQAIASLGFRGEALASIAAVSRLELQSRAAGVAQGASLRVDFGRRAPVKEAPAAPGTRVVVEDLFAELPARRKFLKRPSTELAHCAAWVERLALAHPGVGFRAEHDGNLLFEVEAGDDLDARCAEAFGAGVAERMIHVEAPGPPLDVHARIGPPESARRDARRVHLFLNGRWVRDARLLAAVREGVREFVPVGHYPTLHLALTLSPERVDVNVHPQKTEVRFRDERLVFGTIVSTLRRALAESPWATRSVGAVGGRVSEGFPAPRAPRPPHTGATGARLATARGGAEESGTGATAAREAAAPGSEAAAEGRADARPRDALPLEEDPASAAGAPVLSVANTFVVRAVEGGLEILDQHALHERVNLEELRAELRDGEVVVQPLLVPALVEVDREELDLLLGRAESFRRLGVDLEAFGDRTVAIRGVPARLSRLDPEALVRDLLEIAREQRAASPEQLQEEALFRMACRGAVMAGDHVDAEALQGLLRRGARLPQDRTCAHGRPVRVFLSVEDLERAFYRR